VPSGIVLVYRGQEPRQGLVLGDIASKLWEPEFGHGLPLALRQTVKGSLIRAAQQRIPTRLAANRSIEWQPQGRAV